MIVYPFALLQLPLRIEHFPQVTCRENPKCRKMDLSSFLLAPVQRIMK